ncbi:hypothetical protein ACFL1E_06760 [Candidatus Omnitrophota bacterium]
MSKRLIFICVAIILVCMAIFAPRYIGRTAEGIRCAKDSDCRYIDCGDSFIPQCKMEKCKCVYMSDHALVPAGSRSPHFEGLVDVLLKDIEEFESSANNDLKEE